MKQRINHQILYSAPICQNKAKQRYAIYQPQRLGHSILRYKNSGPCESVNVKPIIILVKVTTQAQEACLSRFSFLNIRFLSVKASKLKWITNYLSSYVFLFSQLNRMSNRNLTKSMVQKLVSTVYILRHGASFLLVICLEQDLMTYFKFLFLCFRDDTKQRSVLQLLEIVPGQQ